MPMLDFADKRQNCLKAFLAHFEILPQPALRRDGTATGSVDIRDRLPCPAIDAVGE